MASICKTALILLVIQVCASAAPSDLHKHEELENPDIQPLVEKENVNSNRQKRFYNQFGYPPYGPLPAAPLHKRDQASDLGVYGLVEDPLNGINRRLQEIAAVTRQAPPPPPITPHFPFFFPIFFIPQYDCQCPTPSPPTPAPPTPQTPTDKPANGTSPNIENRIPEMEDERQNWGLVADDDGDDGEDYSRPISFDPIRLNVSTQKPAPPVEHGSNQAGESAQGTTTTTMKPIADDAPMLSTAGIAPYPPSSQMPRKQPSTCDSAVLSCCHMPQVTYDCFATLGCPDPTSYGNPCDPLVILKVISKFQSYYGFKSG